ncbi:hypothetical protein ACTG21_07925 [Aeromonas sp. 94A]|uniref:hypothetical protein n=1 Tax=Aeromonas sp. 94A TaxID=3452728 RepID=UPI003F7A2EF6
MSSEKASLHHLSNEGSKIELKSFNLHSVHEERRSFPASVEMKSFLDLVSSMLMIMKSAGGKWIVCEGSDDKNYLEKLIDPRHNDVNILPLGGVSNVVKLFEYFRIAASDKIERIALKGKILFIIDSDKVRLDIDASVHKEVCNKISIRRFQMFDDGPKLIEPKNAGLYTETELEDCLDAADFYFAAEQIITENYNAFSKNFKQNKDLKFTEINNLLKSLIPKGAKGYQDLNVIKSILSNHKIKYDISMNYKQSSPLAWANDINSYFD